MLNNPCLCAISEVSFLDLLQICGLHIPIWPFIRLLQEQSLYLQLLSDLLQVSLVSHLLFRWRHLNTSILKCIAISPIILTPFLLYSKWFAFCIQLFMNWRNPLSCLLCTGCAVKSTIQEEFKYLSPLCSVLLGTRSQLPQLLSFHRLLKSLLSSLQSFSVLTYLNSHTALQSLVSYMYCDKWSGDTEPATQPWNPCCQTLQIE